MPLHVVPKPKVGDAVDAPPVQASNASEGTTLICYVASLETEIDRNDVLGFMEVLHNISENTPIDLLLSTGGGDVDACEKLVRLILAKAFSTSGAGTRKP